MGAAAPAVEAAGRVIQVPADQPTIQRAIDTAMDGDTVLVGPGWYRENVDFHGKNVIVQSSTGPSNTIIDGMQRGPVVTFQSGETSSAVLRGFLIRNGSFVPTDRAMAGGVAVSFASPTIEGNVIADNVGGGIGATTATPTIRWNYILRNAKPMGTNSPGGGIAIDYSNVPEQSSEIIGNWIEGNSSDIGGGIGTISGGVLDIRGNVIIRNRAWLWGGGFLNYGDSATVFVQNWITGNAASQGTGLYLTPIRSEPALFLANAIYDNVSINPDGSPGPGAAVWEVLADAYLMSNYVTGEPGHPLFACDTNVYPPPGRLVFQTGNVIVTPPGGVKLVNCSNVTGTP